METMLETKLLDLNMLKSVVLVVGKDKYKKEISSKLESTPLTLYNKPMKKVDEYVYLGEVIHSGGLSSSISATISKRIGIATKSIFEIKSIIEDPRNNKFGGLFTAIQIWNMAVIPALLYSSEVWLQLNPKDLQRLDRLEETFLRTIVQTAQSCPKVGLDWFSGELKMKHKIMKRKLLFLHHVYHLKDKCQWKRTISEAVKDDCRDELLHEMKSYSKLKFTELQNDDFSMKKYFKMYSLKDARTKFAVDCKMLQTIKSNLSSDKEYRDELWQCEAGCGRVDTIRHVQVCPGYEALRYNRDMDDSLDVVHYLQDVLELRMGINKFV